MNIIFSKSLLPRINTDLLFMLCLFLCHPLWAQQNISYPNFAETLPAIDSTIHLSDYDKVFVVHFQFCTSTKYCGEALIKYIAHQNGDPILIICDNIQAKILTPLKMQNRFVFKEINSIALTQYGLFSVYNLYLNPRKKKLKKLQ